MSDLQLILLMIVCLILGAIVFVLMGIGKKMEDKDDKNSRDK